MGVWLDRIIVTAIVVGGLFIMYRGLKEPIDQLGGLIGKGISAIKNKMSDVEMPGGYETITYG